MCPLILQLKHGSFISWNVTILLSSKTPDFGFCSFKWKCHWDAKFDFHFFVEKKEYKYMLLTSHRPTIIRFFVFWYSINYTIPKHILYYVYYIILCYVIFWKRNSRHFCSCCPPLAKHHLLVKLWHLCWSSKLNNNFWRNLGVLFVCTAGFIVQESGILYWQVYKESFKVLGIWSGLW